MALESNKEIIAELTEKSVEENSWNTMHNVANLNVSQSSYERDKVELADDLNNLCQEIMLMIENFYSGSNYKFYFYIQQYKPIKNLAYKELKKKARFTEVKVDKNNSLTPRDPVPTNSLYNQVQVSMTESLLNMSYMPVGSKKCISMSQPPSKKVEQSPRLSITGSKDSFSSIERIRKKNLEKFIEVYKKFKHTFINEDSKYTLIGFFKLN